MHRIGTPRNRTTRIWSKGQLLWPGPSGRIAPSAWIAVQDSTDSSSWKVADERPRVRHRVRLCKASNATKLPADLGLHPASRTLSIECAAPSHLNYFSEQKYCLPGSPSGSSLVTAGPEPVPNLQSLLSRAARLRGRVSLTEPGSIRALIIKAYARRVGLDTRNSQGIL